MFVMLMQMQPEVLLQLGLSEDAIRQEVEKLDKIKTLKVSVYLTS